MPVPLPRTPRHPQTGSYHAPSPPSSPPSSSPSPSSITSSPTISLVTPTAHHSQRTPQLSSQRHDSNRTASSISQWRQSVSESSQAPSASQQPERAPPTAHSQRAADIPSPVISPSQNNLPRPIGAVYASSSAASLPPTTIEAGEDPWDGEAAAFVVFHGAIPGIYATW